MPPSLARYAAGVLRVYNGKCGQRIDLLNFVFPLCPSPALALTVPQIGVEVHFQIARGDPMENRGWTGGVNFGGAPAAWSSSHMSLTFLHMANLGYAPIFREDNPWENLGCCSEFTFLKVEGHC
jgi:hypothetical protein